MTARTITSTRATGQRLSVQRRPRGMRIVLLFVIFVACSHDVHATFPAPAGAPTGTLVLLLGQPASDVAVAINGQLVVEDEHTSRITIEHVPVGTAEVVFAG